jgi:FkbM family methyltransferase
MKNQLKSIAKGLGLYPVFQRTRDLLRYRKMHRNFWTVSEEDQARLDFYRQFVGKGSLVFDVGCNLGNRAKIFSLLGATVVGVEPQTLCAVFLRRVYRNHDNFHLEETALGAEPGEATLMVSQAHMISSLSPEWIESVKRSGRFQGYKWEKSQTVRIDTLDNLIAKYGVPAFIKIDVEGFEDQVLAGLSRPVDALSIEVTPEHLKNTLECINLLSDIGCWEYQFSSGESMKFALDHWVTQEEIARLLNERILNQFGDLYAKCIENQSSRTRQTEH